jgi:hypothetical protein
MRSDTRTCVLTMLGVLSLVIIPFLAFPGPASARAACGVSATIAWKPTESVIAPDTDFSADITIKVASALTADGADITFIWDPSYMSVQDIQPGADWPNELSEVIGSGTARYAVGAPFSGQLPSGKIHVARVLFHSASAVAGETSLTFTATTVACAGNVLTLTLKEGSVKIEPAGR